MYAFLNSVLCVYVCVHVCVCPLIPLIPIACVLLFVSVLAGINTLCREERRQDVCWYFHDRIPLPEKVCLWNCV